MRRSLAKLVAVVMALARQTRALLPICQLHQGFIGTMMKSCHINHRDKVIGRLSSTSRVSNDCAGLLNEQITHELEASQLYLSACIWCEGERLDGMASYMLAEAEAERRHALGIVAFAQKRGIAVKLAALEAPKSGWETPLALWKDLLGAEQENTQSLYRFADAAQQCSDHALTAFLMPYHQEQVESEANLEAILEKVREESQTPGLLRQLDSSLLVPPKLS